MPLPDPVPSPRLRLLRRFRRIMRGLALMAIALAALTVAIVGRGDGGSHIHLLIATALGVGLTALLGTGMMALLLLGSANGHEQAAHFEKEDRP